MAAVSKLKDVPGRATCMSYSADGRLDSVLRPEGNLINYYYDDAGRLTRKESGYPATLPAWTGSCIDDLSKAALPVPNTAGHTADLQTIQVIHYDGSGHADQVVDGSGLGVQIINDGLGRPIDVIDGAGNHHFRGYDARGRVAWEATLGANAPAYGKPQGPAANLHTMVEYQYDNLDRVVEVDRWHFANGQWVNSAHPKATTTIVYDDAHATVSVSQDGESPTITQVDALGRPVVRTLPNQSLEKFGYAENGTKGERVARSFTGSDGKLKSDVSYFDDYGHLLEVDDDTGTPLLVNALDDLNRVYSRSAGKVVAQYDFDGLGRVASFHEGTGSTARELLYSWDGNDRLKSVQDANKAVTAYFYNGLDLKMSAQHPANGTSTWHYVPGSTRLNDYTDPFGTTEVFAYDQVGRVYSEHRTNAALLFGDGIDRIFTYTPAGLLETVTVEGNTKNPANGSIVSFKYDSLGNRVYEDSSLSSLTIGQVFGPHSGPTQTWLYPRGASSPSATISRAFDSLGRLQQISVNQIQVATFEHEAGAGRVDYGKQGIVSIPTFDHRNRLVGVDVLQGGTAVAQVHDAVGIDGIVRERQRQFGVSAPMTDFFSVDDAGRVTDENNAMPGFAMMALPAGDVTDKTVRPYFDDPGSRGTTFRSYALDGVGNWLSRTDSQGTQNTQFTSAAGLDQYYSDPTGETWAYQAGTATQAGSNAFTLDALGQLNQGSSPTDSLHFTYDALGRRVAEQGTSSGANELVWNGNEVIALGPGTTAQRHVLRVVGDGQDQTIALIQALGTGAVTYVHTGTDGSALAATTDAGLVEGYAYTAFGETSFFEGSRRIGGSAIGNRFLFQGQLYDPSLGTYSMRAREYLPRAGRFISPDPLGIGGGENVYAFCLGKPLFLTDPFGLSPVFPSAGGAPIQLSVNGHDVSINAVPALHVAGIDQDVPLGDAWRYSAPAMKLPQFEEVVANTFVTAPMHVMAPFFSGNEENAARWQGNMQSVRPFPYAPDQQAAGSAMEGAFVGLATAGYSIASSTDEAVAAFAEQASLARTAGADLESTATVVEERTALASPWPPNRGFLGEPTTETLEAGARIDRYGYPKGTFASPEGEAFEARALHPSSMESPYHVYEVLKPIDVQAGRAMPWFGYRGLGVQYELPDKIQTLIDAGFLKEVQ
jgi:RHS repeat-associated protein